MKPKVIKPAGLSTGDVIGIAAPSGPFEEDLFNTGVAALEDMGFKVLIPEGLQQAQGYLAGPDSLRAALLMDMFKNPLIKGIVCARGGYGSMRILDHIDFNVIRKNPKVFIGFSDISALIATIIAQCDLVVFHGPVATSLGKASSKTKNALKQAVSKNQALEFKAANPIIVKPGQGTGVVKGGNLATLSHLVGTPYSPNFIDSILVLEDIDEALYKIDRMLTQLKLAGCFKDLKGLVLGSFHNSGNYETICNIVNDVLQDFKIPILAGFDIGHGDHNLTIPMGLQASLDTNTNSLVYYESATNL